MGAALELDYYYGIEAEQFSFYRVPRLLIKDERFKGLSSDAKLLYGLMLDRMSLSMKNEWLDEENRAFIIYAVDAIMEDLGCSKPTCIKIIKELDTENGIGLIERKRRGLGKPDIIYVKNFASFQSYSSNDDCNKEPSNTDNSTEVKNLYFKKEKKLTSGSKESELQQVKDFDLQEKRNFTSAGKETELPEVKQFAPNYNNTNHTDFNYTEENHINPIYQGSVRVYPEQKQDRMDKMDEAQAYIDLIKKNIDYDFYMNPANGRRDRDIFNEVFEVMVDIVIGKRDTVVIGGAEYPHEVVKSRFLKINSMTVEYVIDKVTNNLGEIRNIRNYLITALYNAPTTHSTYFSQLVHHDMYGGGRNWSEEM